MPTDDGVFPLLQIAQITYKNPALAVVDMATMPQYLKNAVQALEKSGMGLSPQQEKTSIFVPLPKVTRDHREKLAKGAKTLCTKHKDKMRDHQNNLLRNLTAKAEASSASKDLKDKTREHVMNVTKDFVAELDKLVIQKQEELLEQDETTGKKKIYR